MIDFKQDLRARQKSPEPTHCVKGSQAIDHQAYAHATRRGLLESLHNGPADGVDERHALPRRHFLGRVVELENPRFFGDATHEHSQRRRRVGAAIAAGPAKIELPSRLKSSDVAVRDPETFKQFVEASREASTAAREASAA